MTLVKHPLDNFDHLNADPVTKFAEKEKERKEDYWLKVFGTIIFLLMLICGLLFGNCN